VTFWADGPRCDGGETVPRCAHAAENGNPHSLEEAWREGEELLTAEFFHGCSNDSVPCARVSLLKMH